MKKTVILTVMICMISGCSFATRVDKTKLSNDKVTESTTDVSGNDIEDIKETDTIIVNQKDAVVSNNTEAKKDEVQISCSSNAKETTSSSKTSNNNSTSTTTAQKKPTTPVAEGKPVQPTTPSTPSLPSTPKDESKAETKVETIKPNYQVGNCGKLFDSESKAYAEAEHMMDTYDDGIKYISGYLAYSTYDKWSVNYYYTNW